MQRLSHRLRLAALAALAGASLAGLLAERVGIAAGSHVDWPTISFDIQRDAWNPQERTINPGNVAGLKPAWSFATDGVVDTSPVVAANVAVASLSYSPIDIVYFGSEHGMLYAVDAKRGRLVWQKNLGSLLTACGDLPGKVFGITSAPVIDRSSSRVFVAAVDGKVHAFDLATSTESDAGWPVTVTAVPTQEHVWSGLTLTNGRLYAETASYCDITPYHGQIAEIDVASATVLSRFYPTGANGPDGGAIWGWAGASVNPGDGNVFVATGNALPDTIQSYGYAEHVVRLTPDLGVVSSDYPGLVGPDVDFGSTPTLFQRSGCPAQLAAENKSGVLVIYDRDNIGAGPVQRLQMADVNDEKFVGNPAWYPATNSLYVANSSDSNSAVAPAPPSPGPFKHGMVALKEGTDCRFSLAWQSTVGPSQSVLSLPVVANGVVYYGDGTGGQVLAFDAATGAQLWSSKKTIGGPIFAEPIVVNGMVFAGSWDQALHAYSLP